MIQNTSEIKILICGPLNFNLRGIHYSLMKMASREGRKQPYQKVRAGIGTKL